MAIQVGRANAVVLASQTVTTNIDVNVGFTPTAGQYICLVYWSGHTSATDAVGSNYIFMGWGMGTSATVRRGMAGCSQDAQASSAADKVGYSDAILKATSGAAAVTGALDFGGEITNGVRFTVDDQFPADIRFNVVVIDGLTDVGIFDITSPSGTGNANHTGAGVDAADLFLFMGVSGAVGTSLQMMFGAAHADGQCGVSLVSRNGQPNMSTNHYCTDLECIVYQGVTGPPNFRASYVASITDGLTLNWLETSAGTVFFCAALKGIEATIQNALTQTDTTTDIVVTGLGNICLGGLVVSCCEAESTQDTAGTHHHWSMGSFTSTTNRGAHATWDESGTANSETAVAVEYDEVYANISSADAIQGLMDIKSLDSGGATFIMDDADPAQKWFSTILFATPTSGTAYSLDAEVGSYALTGADSTPLAAMLLDAAAGSYAITGADAVLPLGLSFNAEAGTYSITGADATLLAALLLDAGAGSYTVIGADAALSLGVSIDAEAGTYSLAGADAALSLGIVLNAEAGSYLISGADAVLFAQMLLNAESGSLVITGADATFLVVSVGAYELDAEAGSYAITGATATLKADIVIEVEPGVYQLTGASVDLTVTTGGVLADGDEVQVITVGGIECTVLIGSGTAVRVVVDSPKQISVLVAGGAPIKVTI